MNRFDQLVDSLEVAYPHDWWIASRRESRKILPASAFPQLTIYENALNSLDQTSWELLYSKTHKYFSQERTSRGKNQFFNILNEALAYEFLSLAGFHNVRLLSEIQNRKNPDISYDSNNGTCYCEVKTIANSETELKKRQLGEAFSGTIYTSLGESFFQKLSSTINSAMTQIEALNGTGLVFLIIHFDDFTLTNIETYELQISEFFKYYFPMQDIIARVGIENARYISHVKKPN